MACATAFEGLSQQRIGRPGLGLVGLLGMALASPLGAVTLQGAVSVSFTPSSSALDLSLYATGDVYVDFTGASWSTDASLQFAAVDNIFIDATAIPSWPAESISLNDAEPIMVNGDVWLGFAEGTVITALDLSADRNLYVWNFVSEGSTLSIGSGGDIAQLPPGDVYSDLHISSGGTITVRNVDAESGGGIVLSPGRDIQPGRDMPLGPIQVVPIPASAMLFMSGMPLLAAFMRRRESLPASQP